MSSDRRRAPRYQFIADAEVTEVLSGARSRVKTGDLSSGGCFLRTAAPPAEGTEVQVTIFQAGDFFTALGRVVFVFPKMGMGIVFTRIGPIPQATLEKWLTELDRDRSARIGLESPAVGLRRT